MITSSIRKNKHGEPVWTIRVTGTWEIFRFAYHLVQGQVEFMRMGDRAFRYLRRRMGRASFVEHDVRMTGGRIEKVGYGKGSGRES